MQVLQAGQHKLILLELDPEQVANAARQAGFETKLKDSDRHITLDLTAEGEAPHCGLRDYAGRPAARLLSQSDLRDIDDRLHSAGHCAADCRGVVWCSLEASARTRWRSEVGEWPPRVLCELVFQGRLFEQRAVSMPLVSGAFLAIES